MTPTPADADEREELAKFLYDADHNSLSDCWSWDESGLDDEHPHARERYYRLADALLRAGYRKPTTEAGQVPDTERDYMAAICSEAKFGEGSPPLTEDFDIADAYVAKGYRRFVEAGHGVMPKGCVAVCEHCGYHYEDKEGTKTLCFGFNTSELVATKCPIRRTEGTQA